MTEPTKHSRRGRHELISTLSKLFPRKNSSVDLVVSGFASEIEAETIVPQPASVSPLTVGGGRRVASGAIWVTIEMAVTQAISLFVFAFLAHFLSPRAFGLAALCYALIFSLRIIVLDSILTPVIREVSPTDLDYTTAFWLTVIIGLLGTGMIEFASVFVDPIFHVEGLGRVLRVLGAIFLPLALGRAQEAWLARNFRFRVLALRSIAAAVLGGVCGVLSAMGGFGIWSLVMQQLVNSFGALALLWWTSPWRPSFDFNTSTAKKIWIFQCRLGPSAVLSVFNQNADTALVAAFFGPSIVGFYSVAKRLRLALQLIATTPIRAVTLPVLSELQDDAAAFKAMLLRSTLIIVSITAPVFLGAAAVSGDAISVLFGEKWVLAAPIFAWLSAGAFCMALVDYISVILQLRDRPHWQSCLGIIQTATSSALFVSMVYFGKGAVAMPFVLPYLVVLPLSLCMVSLLLEIRSSQWLYSICLPVLCAIGMAVIVNLLSSRLVVTSPFQRLAILSVSGAIVYSALMLMVFYRLIMASFKQSRLRVFWSKV